ncbi:MULTISPECIES: hypothetical protein [unclassified Sinorhizobium]|uniref:hypothetical protein n=1 Tax=unclassified Sinorhizobium TaxID=2613772 RepID=UPI003523E61B
MAFDQPNRWNNRKPGKGRFPGYGIVRMFGPHLIQLALHDPKLSSTFHSTDAALAALRSVQKQ